MIDRLWRKVLEVQWAKQHGVLERPAGLLEHFAAHGLHWRFTGLEAAAGQMCDSVRSR